MDVNERVKHTIDHIVHDIDRIGSVVRVTEAEMETAMKEPLTEERWASMRSSLSEVHARLDGLRSFALACERRMAGSESEEELDVWL